MTEYCLQSDNARLGNFINLTPTLQSLASVFGEPIPTYFETEYVKQCFINCPFITLLDKKPTHEPLISSTAYKRKVYINPDYQYIWETYSDRYNFNHPIPHTYVDEVELTHHTRPYVVISNGSGAYDGKYEHLKIIDPIEYQNVVDQIEIDKIIVGSKEDHKYSPKGCVPKLDNIRESLAFIKGAEFVVTNDGGVMHAAIALKKPTFILWKNTNHVKSQPPGGYICREDYANEFRKWRM